MNKQAKEVTKADLIPADDYAKNRKSFRKLLPYTSMNEYFL